MSVAEVQAALARLHLFGSAERPMAETAPAAVASEVAALLDHPSFAELSPEDRGAALFRVLLIYSGAWNSEGRGLIPSVERAFSGLLADAPDDLTALCSGYDCLFFLYWCWGASLAEQTGFAENVAAPFAATIRRHAPAVSVSERKAYRGIGYLAQFLAPGPGNAIAGANRVVLEALAERRERGPVFLYAWMFHDEASLAAAERLGIQVRPITGHSPAERVAKLEQAILLDQPEILISDMNASIPAVLYERRVAPVQILYQFGMPHWPLANLDGIFRVWEFDPALAGYDPARCRTLTIPYDLAPFAQAADPAALARERARLPPGRLVGTYGRLAKITPEFVGAVVEGIRAHPTVTAVFGGMGDAAPLRTAIAATGMPDRFAVVEGYVDGHLWGNLLEVFLDTFPQPGGASCLEVIAKCKPVVSMMTPEAVNLAREQRVEMLRGTDTADYAAILSRLLGSPAFAAEAVTQTRTLAAAYPTAAGYGLSLFAAIDHVCKFALIKKEALNVYSPYKPL